MLKQTIDAIIDRIFDNSDSIEIAEQERIKYQAQVLQIAKRLFENGVDYDTIKKSTGLPDELLRVVEK